MKSYTDSNLTRETGRDTQAGEASEQEDVNINWLSALSGHQLEMPDPVKIVLVQRSHPHARIDAQRRGAIALIKRTQRLAFAQELNSINRYNFFFVPSPLILTV